MLTSSSPLRPRYDTDNETSGVWITVPIAVKMIFIQNSADISDPAAEPREVRSLFNVLCIMKDRFSGGQFVSNMLDAVLSHIFLAGGKNSRHEVTGLLQDCAAIIAKGLAHGIVPNAKL
ncbi:uncharacterized protein PAC_02345 [Phialocephala subalpina]|uniref:Uncharacterized protein n=1 Tax=Phialocephala subalpina TaxID=576137 RepID=A0A1L7WI72_9HELO|nr:uncharacterized protein PAC_02345 [Phialocephala subalpina]